MARDNCSVPRRPPAARGAALAAAAASAIVVAFAGAASSAGTDPDAHPAATASSSTTLPPTKWTGTVTGSELSSTGGPDVAWTANVRFDEVPSHRARIYLYGATGSVTYTYSGGDLGCTFSGSDTFQIDHEDGALGVYRRSGHWEYDVDIGVDDPSLHVHYRCVDESGVDEGMFERIVSPVLYNNRKTRTVRVGTGTLAGSYQDGSYSVNWNFTGTPRRGGLRAEPGGPYTVTRAGRIRLDGSGSRPRREITDYIWRFRTSGGDCENGPVRTGQKQGRVVNVVALCDLRATLTVVDRDGDRDSKSTAVNVKPRHWRTPPLAHREKTGDPRTPRDPPSATALGGGNFAFSIFGGLNVSDCGGSEGQILCPVQNGGTWLGGGYELAQVNDPKGPFDGFSYVASSQITVKRAGLINPTILPGSTFYQHNQAAGRDVAGFVNAIRQHEGLGNGTSRSGHSLIMKTILQSATGDPRRVIEKLFAPGREGAKERVDKALGAIERRLDQESADPLPDIWTGTIEFYDSYQQQWITGEGFRIPGPMRG